MVAVETSRLTGGDIYRYIDVVDEHWADDELVVTPRLQALRRQLDELSDPHRQQALSLYWRLCESRFRAGPDGRACRVDAELIQLRAVVASWEQNRPSLIVCGHDYGNGRRCTVAERIPHRLAEHRYYIHDGPLPEHFRETAA